MQFPARLVFRNSTCETTLDLDQKPTPGDVIQFPTRQGKLRLQVSEVKWLFDSPDGMIAELRFFDPPAVTFRYFSYLIKLFAAFPEIRELGRDRLQSICAEWLTTPVARETCVIDIRIDQEFVLGFKAEVGNSPKEDEVYHFPADNLLRFIAEKAFTGQAQDSLFAKITKRRQALGSDVFQRFLLSGPV